MTYREFSAAMRDAGWQHVGKGVWRHPERPGQRVDADAVSADADGNPEPMWKSLMRWIAEEDGARE